MRGSPKSSEKPRVSWLEAVCLGSRLREFEKWFADCPPKKLFAMMPSGMCEDVRRLSPRLINWLRALTEDEK